MSFIHNRTGALALVAALAVLLLGAGCSKQSGPAEPAAPTNIDASSQPADAATGSEIRWAEYRSEKLGITIPYPEGWYVREDQSEDATTILIDPAPVPPSGSGSDSPIRVTVTVTPLTLEEALASYEAATTTAVVFGTTNATKVEYRSELGGELEEPSYREAYHWSGANRLYTVDGTRGDAIASYIASMLATREE